MNSQLLTLADLARLLEAHGMNRSLIQRYDTEADFRAVMQKDESAKGYPAWTLPIWEKIAEAREKEPLLVRPKLASRFVERLLPSATGQQLIPVNRTEPVKENNRLTGNDLVPVNQPISETMPTVDAVMLAQEQGRAQGLAMSDEIMTVTQAAEFLQTTPTRLCRIKEPYLKLGKERRHWRWRKSDLIG